MKFILIYNFVLCEKLLSCSAVLLPLLPFLLLHHYLHIVVMELNHLLTLPTLTYPGVSSVVILGFFCLWPVVFYYPVLLHALTNVFNVVLVPEHFMKVHHDILKSSEHCRPKS
jgi:hypothetical protein